MHRIPKALSAASILAAVCFLPPDARADGVHLPARAFEKPAEIPGQRALIVHRNGIETLWVESTIRSDSPELAWILPLPAVPMRIEPATPGVLKTLAFCIQPRIVSDLSGWAWASWLCVIVLGLGALFTLSRSPIVSSLARSGLVTLCMLLVLAFLGFSSLSVSRAGGFKKVAGISMQHEDQVGDYRVAVLQAEAADALDSWLDTNGFRRLDPRARSIVEEYLRNRWCFAVARLSGTGGRPASHHPLKVTFRSASPVYPMRLTALSGSTPHFEIFAVSGRPVVHPGMEASFIDRYREVAAGRDEPTWYRGECHGQGIGHPAIVEAMWDGCVLTKLSGTLVPARMTDDLHFEPAAIGPRRKLLFTRRAAGHLGFAVAGGMFMLGFAALMVLPVFRTGPQGRELARATCVFTAAVALLAGCVADFLSPVIREDRVAYVRRGKRSAAVNRIVAMRNLGLIQEALASALESGKLTSDLGPEDVEAIVKRSPELDLSSIADEALMEDSPGNYRIAMKDGRWEASWFDELGREHPAPPAKRIDTGRRTR